MVTPYKMPDSQPIRHRVGLAVTLYCTHTETDLVTGLPVDITAPRLRIRFRLWNSAGALLATKDTTTVGVTILDGTHYTVDLATGGESKGLAADFAGSYEIDCLTAGSEGPLALGLWTVAGLDE